jgi:hypothetical protein
MRSHQGLRPFVCNECGAQFTMKNNFKRHVEEHAGQRYGTYAGGNADPDPAGQNQCRSRSGWPKSVRIRIRLSKVNADPDPAGQNKCGYGSGWLKSMWMRIRLAKINADLDPAAQNQCGSGSGWPKSRRIRIRLTKIKADPAGQNQGGSGSTGQNQCGSGSGWLKSMRVRIHNTSFKLTSHYNLPVSALITYGWLVKAFYSSFLFLSVGFLLGYCHLYGIYLQYLQSYFMFYKIIVV